MTISHFPMQLRTSSLPSSATPDQALMQALRTLSDASEPIKIGQDSPMPIWT